VTIPEGEPRVIVQAVLSARRTDQFVVVERSLTGVTGGSTPNSVPPDEPRLPIAGAVVILTHRGPSSCTPASDTLNPRSSGSGIYETSGFCPLTPGDRVDLRVVTPEGDVVTGSTTVPGARTVSVRLAADSATGEGDLLQLDLQRDTIRIAVDPILARALQVEVRWREEPDSLVVYLVTDSLGIALPADLYNPFAGDSGKPVFEVGREYTLGVAVTDTNYYDFVRSRSDPFTGRGFLNRLEGGIGVFGSVETYRYYLRVVR
ncbi:MAG: DUF4249 domain-containing protein, partial [Gemmatimonadota bacterium]|nr:DUF4249 domain-containing protein [Gemmatimonadota bacterium]